MSEAPVAKMSFEEAIAELENVVGQLESGDVPLDRSIALYERGAALRKRCADKLAEAEARIEKIKQNERGDAIGTAPLDEVPAEAKPARAGSDKDDEIPF